MKILIPLCAGCLLGAGLPVYSNDIHLVKHLNQAVTQYQFPEKNHNLSIELHALMNNDALVHKICQANPNPDHCLHSVYSLTHEALGLANISHKPKPAYRQMAQEDKAQLQWYFRLYLHNSIQ